MLTEAQFAEQQRQLGCRIHEHDGVYWEEVHPFYCKPAFIFKAFDRGTARPARGRSLLGYSHPVCRPEEGNRTVPVMVLERTRLENFDLPSLPQKKRNNVRRALEQCEVRLIDDLEAQLERIREINVSQALRHEKQGGAEIPASRYTAEAEDWRAQMRREFPLAGREWWGAFVDGTLAAYLRTFQVAGIRVIQLTKADTDHLKAYPMDALYFKVLQHAAEDPACRMILNGRPQHPSLNHYKEQFLFQAAVWPYYSSNAWLLELGKRMLRLRQRVRRRSEPKLSPPPSLGAAGQETP